MSLRASFLTPPASPEGATGLAETETSRGAPVDAWTVSTAAAGAAAVLAATSTGSMVVAAGLLAVATRQRWLGLVALLAVASVGIRFSTVGFDDVAGLQSVLGPAGVVGPATGAASSWAAAAALVLCARRLPAPPANARRRFPGWARRAGLAVPGLAAGAFAAAVVAGPGPSDLPRDLVVRVGASLIAAALAVVVAAFASPADPAPTTGRDRVVTGAAVLAAVVAVVLAGWSG